VTHGQCDARPKITFPACADTKLVLLGDVCEQLAQGCTRQHDGHESNLLIASPAPYHYATDPHQHAVQRNKKRRVFLDKTINTVLESGQQDCPLDKQK